jgi:CRP/FNR family cyclic AMP-dependent transcriptional regulator
MIQESPEADLFKEQMRASLAMATKNSVSEKIAKRHAVYAVGDEVETVYFIESGQIKLVMVSSGGKECLLAIHGPGDVFGELCLSGLEGRLETATAMEDSVLKKIPCDKFLERLADDSLLPGFVKYLTLRVADQQQVIANLVTADSEQRLASTLLQLARTKGMKDPHSIRIKLKISHDELASMIGTTRPRISVFMQRFRNLGLLEMSEDHHIIIKEGKLTSYLESIA